MSAEAKTTVKTILELLDDDGEIVLTNVNDSNLPEPPIVSYRDVLLRALRQEILDASIINIVSTLSRDDVVTEIYYRE